MTISAIMDIPVEHRFVCRIALQYNREIIIFDMLQSWNYSVLGLVRLRMLGFNRVFIILDCPRQKNMTILGFHQVFIIPALRPKDPPQKITSP